MSKFVHKPTHTKIVGGGGSTCGFELKALGNWYHNEELGYSFATVSPWNIRSFELGILEAVLPVLHLVTKSMLTRHGWFKSFLLQTIFWGKKKQCTSKNYFPISEQFSLATPTTKYKICVCWLHQRNFLTFLLSKYQNKGQPCLNS